MDIQDVSSLLRACQLLGVETDHKTRAELQCDCWQALAFSNANYAEQLFSMLKQAQSLVEHYEQVVNERDALISKLIDQQLSQLPMEGLAYRRMNVN